MMDQLQDVDYILENYTGGGNWWQWRMLLLFVFAARASSLPLLLHLFAAFEPQHRCFVQNCDGSESLVNESHIQFTIPSEHFYQNILKEKEKFDPCKRFASNTKNEIFDCLPQYFHNNETVDCEAYIYDQEIFTRTLTTDLDLVCEDGDNKRKLLSTLMMLGLLVGSIIGGRLGDKYGRKKVLFGSFIVMAPSVALAGVYPNYILYASLRFVSATCIPIAWVNDAAYTYELCSPKYRKFIAAFNNFPMAQFVLCLILYFVRDWQHLHFMVGGICAMCIPLLYLFVPESFRWLILHNRKDEAVSILLQIAKTNGRNLSNEDVGKIKEIVSNIEQSSKNDENLTPLQMFRGKFIGKTIILLMAWITACLGYYALALNSVKLAGDPILNFFFAALADSPVAILLIFTLDRIGRRKAMALTHGSIGIGALIMAFIPKSETGIILAVYILGKCAANAGFSLVWMVTNELYPTNLRAQAVGTCSMVSRFFGLCVPFIGGLAKFWQPLPMLVLGIPAIIVGGLAFVLPETRLRDLPQTVSDADENKLNLTQKFKILQTTKINDEITSIKSQHSNQIK